MAYPGLDVSKYQDQIDWDKVAAEGYKFAIIKASEGSEAGSHIADPFYKENVEGAKKAGLKTHAYHYFRGISEKDAKAEAEWFHQNMQTAPVDGIPVVDVEDKTLTQDKEALTRYVNSFIGHLKELGYPKVGLYSGLYFYENRLVPANLTHDVLWIAAYNNKAAGIDCDIWQHTSSGKVDGINGNVDLNFAYDEVMVIIPKKTSSKPTQQSSKPTEKYKIPTPVNLAKEEQKLLNQHGAHLVVDGIAGTKTEAAIKVFQHDRGLVVDGIVGPKTLAALKGQASYYTVKSGDTLIGIAAAHHVSVDGIAKLNHLNNPDKIYPGQKLQLPAAGHQVSDKRFVTVGKGDSLSVIASHNHLTLNQLLKLNPGIDHPDTIYPGQKIRVK